MAQEHQEYIQTKVNPTLENLVTQVLLERPDNPVPFMIRWLAEQTKATPATLDSGEAEKLRAEINALQAEVQELEAKLAASAPALAAAPSVDPAEESEEEDEEDDVVDMPPPPSSYLKKGPRASVSAEAYGDWNKRQDFVPKVHVKSDEQKSRIQAVLSRSFMFNSLDRDDMNIVVDAMVEKPIVADERFIQEGDDGDVMYLIESGKIECKKMIEGEERVVKTCDSGDCIGELALLYNCPRAASVEAREPGTLWQLDRETFNAIVRDSSMKRRETYESFLKCVPLLENLGRYELMQLADSLQREAVAAGANVITQGEQGDRFYVVEEGDLVAVKNGEEVMAYSRGSYFGELSLLRNDVRAASIQAKIDSRLLFIDRRTFNRLLGGVEDFLKQKASQYA